MPSPPRISLIVPSYNEEANLSPLFEQIRAAMDAPNPANPIVAQPLPWELLFVDDGSTDGSLQALRALASTDSRVRYLSFESNQGQSAAFAAGFQEARGDILVTLDADLQNDPADIPSLLALYGEDCEMVIGWREKRRDSLAKRLSSKIANAVRNRLSRETVKDTGCSLKVLNADLARRLPMFTGMHRFLPTLMKMQGARVAEVRVNHRPRLHGSSKYGIWDRAFSALYDLFAIRWMQSRHFRYRIKERK